MDAPQSSIGPMEFVYESDYGKEVTRTLPQVINLADFLGTPGYPWLVLAAGNDLSLMDLEMFLSKMNGEVPGVERTRSWLQRRRWLFRKPGSQYNWANRDGLDQRARDIIFANTRLSARSLVMFLREHGIERSREWVRRSRVPLTDDNHRSI